MFRWSLLVLALSGCAHLFPPPAPPPLSPDASAFFDHADAEDNSGSVVVDFDVLRELGFLKPVPAGEHSLGSDLIAYTLPTIAGELKNEPEGQLLARSAVLFALFREWDHWPRVKRAGLILPKTDDPEASGDRLVALMAIEGPLETSQIILDSLAAADRAGDKPALTKLEGHLCLPPDRQKERWCLKAGPGYVAIGTPVGLGTLPDLLKPVAAHKVMGPTVFRFRMNIPTFGKGYFIAEPGKGVRVRGAFASPREDVAASVEQKVNEILAQLDARHESQRELIEPVLTRTQEGLSKDPQAPPSLQAAASRLTIEGLLDPEGTWATIRKSMVVKRVDKLVTFEAVIPDASIKRAAEGGNAFTAFAAVGLVSSLAIPSLVRYQCEAKQVEVTTTLEAAAGASHALLEHGEKPTTLAAIAFTAPDDSRYTYCLGDDCVPCKAAGCFVPAPDANPCLRLAHNEEARAKYQFLMCAIGDLDGSTEPGDLDVWVVTEDGTPKHLQNDCG
jgi:hypothetical protein